MHGAGPGRCAPLSRRRHPRQYARHVDTARRRGARRRRFTRSLALRAGGHVREGRPRAIRWPPPAPSGGRGCAHHPAPPDPPYDRHSQRRPRLPARPGTGGPRDWEPGPVSPTRLVSAATTAVSCWSPLSVRQRRAGLADLWHRSDPCRTPFSHVVSLSLLLRPTAGSKGSL